MAAVSDEAARSDVRTQISRMNENEVDVYGEIVAEASRLDARCLDLEDEIAQRDARTRAARTTGGVAAAAHARTTGGVAAALRVDATIAAPHGAAARDRRRRHRGLTSRSRGSDGPEGGRGGGGAAGETSGGTAN